MSELKDMFVTKDNKILIEISVNGDVDKVVKELYKAHKQQKQIMNGVTISQIFFEGHDINKIAYSKAKELVHNVQDGVTQLLRKMNN